MIWQYIFLDYSELLLTHVNFKLYGKEKKFLACHEMEQGKSILWHCFYCVGCLHFIG